MADEDDLNLRDDERQLDAMAPDVEETEEEDKPLQISETEEMPDFFDNLAEDLPETYLTSLATTLIEKIEYDKESRKKRDEQYEEGLKRTGLGNDAPGGADFPGASRVVHPVMIEATVDFCARVMKEIYPPNGPVKDKIVGEQTQKKLEKARRKVRHMNWQLTEQCPEFRHELEQTLTQTPMGGDAYIKVWWDNRQKRPRFMMVPVDKVLLPFSASSFYDAERRTHVIDMTNAEMERDQRSGLYRDVPLVAASMDPDPTGAQKANDKIEGKDATGMNEDGMRRVFEISVPHFKIECDAFEDPECEGEEAPYIITIDELSKTVLSIYRNWDPEDPRRAELDYMIDFRFVPWRGAYAIGLPHMIGGLSGAATGALRALLDSAHIQNMPTALKLADPATGGGQTVTAKPTQVSEIGSGMGVDDIRKLAMPMPFNQPSSTLFQLLGFLTDAARGVIRTTYEEIADGQNTPVGTTMARMEQAMVVFSSICARMHDAMARLLRVVHRLNKTNLDDYVTLSETGEVLAYRADYEGPVDVIPVSDPNIFSENQRQAQAFAVVQRATGNPMYDQREVEKLFLSAMKVTDPNKLLIKQPQPERMNPVNENVAMTFGRPVAAFPDQDHLAHIQVHLDYLKSPMLGTMANIMPTLLPAVLEHLKQHVAFWYVRSTYDMVKQALGVDPSEVMVDDPETQEMFDRLLAVSSLRVLQRAEMELAQLPGIVQQAMQMLQQFQPPMPMDPSAVQAMEVQRKTQQDQQIAEQRKQELALKGQKAQDDKQLKIAALMQRDEAEEARTKQAQEKAVMDSADAEQDRMLKEALGVEQIASKERMNAEDNETAMRIAAAEIESAEAVQVSTGTGINPGPNT
jgi:hypothetical protein